MKAIDELGIFWLASHEDDALSGRLQFDPAEGGISLSLVGDFDNVGRNSDDPGLCIHGWIGSQQVTLDQAFLRRHQLLSPGVATSVYRANQLFLGHHLDEEVPTFKKVSFTVSDLDGWVGRTGISIDDDNHAEASQPGAIYRASFTPPAEESSTFSRGRIGLGYLWQSGGNPIEGITFKQWAEIHIEYDEVQPFRVIRKDVGRLQSLITLCIDDRTSIDSLVLTRPDIRATLLNGQDGGHAKRIEFVAPPLRYIDPANRTPRGPHEILVGYEQLGGISTVARWLDVSERFQRPLDSLMSTRHARQMYTENRFLNVTFAAEAFHRTVHDSPEMGDAQLAALLEAYLAQTPEEHHAWLRGRIEFANQPSLRRRLQDLAGRAAPAMRPVIGEKGRWAFALSQVRHDLTHIGANAGMFDDSLLFLSESVYAVVRICMLLEAGVPIEVLERRASAYPFDWYKERLQRSIEKIRDHSLRVNGTRQPSP